MCPLVSPVKLSQRRRRASQESTGTTTTTQSTSSSNSAGNEKHLKKAQSKKAIELLEQPVHVAQDSLFSTSSGWTDYRGFFNLAVLLLVVSNGRVALENIIKYGILINPIEWLNNFLASSPYTWPNLTIVLLSNVSILAAFLLEKALSKRHLNNTVAAISYVILVTLHIFVPAIVVLEVQGNPLYSSWALTVIVIEVLKLISYGHVNYWCRLARDAKANAGENSDKAEIKSINYPHNLTLANIYYFMFAPTLCYELRYPRTPKRRKSFILKRLVELIGFAFVSAALCQQWVMPLVRNSLAPFSDMDIKRCVERVLKLAIPNHLIWLMFFYLMFHSGLNLIAEVMRFADREFYLDFWNSETVSAFWKTWNIPVHRWAVRHVYKPIVRNGNSKFLASMAVFSISAFFHEYLVSVPLHMFRLWACYGMLAQIPMSFFTDHYLKGGRAGNIVVWLSLILGQPMAILMYVHDWYLLHYPDHDRVPVSPVQIPHI
ncbi:MBOAT, membrane-bound o-acyltransferase family domain-containing protein [Ditylenchus destructor]|uniref:O-acyltransferase n=1 Tax=Ditylenchus destructor TaxID=166010 RepID=A0AAD4NJL5_9BILA|nr:MBOAT, membrane-bound o-acyltransferase family domain-containing protein [Ditylenchus destructor]